MYLPLVRLVEQSPAEGDEQNLRYHDSCEKHAQEEYRQKGKMARYLGICMGLFFVVLFF